MKLSSHSSIVGRSLTGTMLAASWKRMRSVGASRRIASISASGRSRSARMKSVILPGFDEDDQTQAPSRECPHLIGPDRTAEKAARLGRHGQARGLDARHAAVAGPVPFAQGIAAVEQRIIKSGSVGVAAGVGGRGVIPDKSGDLLAACPRGLCRLPLLQESVLRSHFPLKRALGLDRPVLLASQSA